MPRKTQYIIAGNGELHMEDGSVHKVGPDSVFVVPTPIKHDLVNVGRETLRAVAFFAAAMFTRNFDNVMLPPKSHILGTPNREGENRMLRFRRRGGFCRFAGLRRRTACCGRSAGQVFIRNRQYVMFGE